MNLLNKLKSMLGEPTEPENVVENTDDNHSEKSCDCAEGQCNCDDKDKSECTCSDGTCEHCKKKNNNE